MSAGIERYRNIPESENLLLASWRSQLASDKAVYREVDAEGSQTANSGTDPDASGQAGKKRHTEAVRDG
jgi:hypothetical protein